MTGRDAHPERRDPASGAAPKLPGWLRAVVARDGLTTDALVSALGEPLSLERVVQRHRRIRRSRIELGLATGEAVLDRWVVFRGEQTGRIRLVAHVEVPAGPPGAPLIRALEQTGATLGEAVRQMVPGARRQPVGFVRAGRLPRAAGDSLPASPWWIRRYRIVVRDAVLALVSEYFPGTEVDEPHARAS